MSVQDHWDFINPAGIVQTSSTAVNAHPRTLEGKTVLLRWNGKHNGAVFMSRIAEMLRSTVKDVKVIIGWEALPETAVSNGSADRSKAFAKIMAALKPDIAIGAQGD